MVAGRPLQTGDTVLVLGTGGVSMFALQFAVMAGARVIATSSSDEKLERVVRLGAFAGVNYTRTPDWHKEVLKHTDGRGVDCVVEVGGVGTLERSFDSIARPWSIFVLSVVSAFRRTATVRLKPGHYVLVKSALIAVLARVCYLRRSTPAFAHSSATVR